MDATSPPLAPAADNGIPVFFKVDERVKKAYFTGSTMQELRSLFYTTYSESGWSADNLSHILIQDPVKSTVRKKGFFLLFFMPTNLGCV